MGVEHLPGTHHTFHYVIKHYPPEAIKEELSELMAAEASQEAERKNWTWQKL